MTMVSDICARQVAAVATTAAGQRLDLVSSIPKASSAWAFENREVSRRNEALIWPLTGGDNNNAFCCYFLGFWLLFHVFIGWKLSSLAWKVMKMMDRKVQCFGTVLQLVCTLSLKLPLSPLCCPHQLVLNSFVGDSVALKSVQDSWNATGSHKLSSKEVSSIYLFIYLYTSFYFPVAKGTTLGSETRLEVCICTREWCLFFFFLFFVVSCYLGEWLLSEHAHFMSVPVEMNSTAIKTLFHVFQTRTRISSSISRLEK